MTDKNNVAFYYSVNMLRTLLALRLITEEEYIHVKIWDFECESDKLDEIVALIRKYDCERHCYFMSRNDAILQKAKEKYPVIGTCVGAGDKPLEMVERAIAIGAEKIQLVRWAYNQEMIDKAHANGIRCNMFWSDDPVEAVEMLKSGIDCILTNDYLAVKTQVEKLL